MGEEQRRASGPGKHPATERETQFSLLFPAPRKETRPLFPPFSRPFSRFSRTLFPARKGGKDKALDATLGEVGHIMKGK